MDVNEHEGQSNLTLKDTNYRKGTACSKKGYGCKWTWDYPTLHLKTQIKVKEQRVVKKDMDVNEHERLSNFTLPQIKVKEQLVVRKDMDVNEHERLSNITLKTQIKVKEQCFYCCSTLHCHSKVFNNEDKSLIGK